MSGAREVAAQPAHLPPGARRAVTAGMVALVSMLAFEALAVTTAMPVVAAALDGTALYGLAFAAPLAAGVVGMVVAGAWSDRRGAAPSTRCGVALFVAGLLLAGAATSMLGLALARAVLGVGSGMASVALYVLVGRLYPPAARAKVFAAFSAAWVLPALVGPLIAGLVVEHLGWRWVFLGVPVLTVPAVLLLRPALAAAVLPGEPGRLPAAVLRRTALAVAVAGAVGLLSFGGLRPGALGIALVAVATASLVLAVPRLLPAGTLVARRGLPTVVVLRGLVSAAFAGAEAFVPLLLVRERGLSPAAAGVVLTVASLSWFAGAAVRGSDRMRLRPATLLASGGVLVALGIVTVALTTRPEVPVAAAMAGWGAAGFGMGLAYPTLSVLTLELSPVAEQGLNSSALQLSDAVGGAVALAVGGALFAALSPALTAYVVCLGLAAGLALLAAGLSPRVGTAR